MYKSDKLRKYMDESSLKVVNEDFRVRLSKKLEEKYETGIYDNAISNFKEYIEKKSNRFKYGRGREWFGRTW